MEAGNEVNVMSFSASAKAELCRDKLQKKCCAVAEACGVLLYCGNVSPEQIRIVTESEEFAGRLPRLFFRAFNEFFADIADSASHNIFFHIINPSFFKWRARSSLVRFSIMRTLLLPKPYRRQIDSIGS